MATLHALYCRRTRGYSFGCVRAGLPRPFLRGEVNRRWHKSTRSAVRGAETGCAPGRFENNSKSSATSLDLMPTLRLFEPSATIQVGRILTGRMLALHVLPVCAYSAPACLYLAFVCVFASLPVLADTACLRERLVLARAPCAQIPCTFLRVLACACALNALGQHPQLQPRPSGGDSPLQSWARGVDTYDWRAAASTLVDFVLTARFCMLRRDPPPTTPPTQHPYIQQPSATYSHTPHGMSANLIKLFRNIPLRVLRTPVREFAFPECEFPTLALYQ